MNPTVFDDKADAMPEFLSGGGEMGQRIREFDWAKTALGPVHEWPQSLRTCIRIMLASRQPIWIGWGKELIKFYNDPYKAIVGGKHPWALGKPAGVVWKDIWKDIGPMLKQVMEKDEGTYVEAQLLIMDRNGYNEETYYTFSYTPIPGDQGGTAGMICANTDDTDRIISERQLKTLTQLGKSLTDSKSYGSVIDESINTIKDNPHDFPFTLFYSIADNRATLTHHTELGESLQFVPKEIDLGADNGIARLLSQAQQTKKPQLFGDIQDTIGAMPRGVWEMPPDKAIVLPIAQSGIKTAYGFLVVGLNPHRLLDEKYSGFFSLVADQVATSFSNVFALEEERKRAAALTAIDLAKTTFFSNISHEFRTPLTLLLGPLEDSMNDPDIGQGARANLDVAYRNALRMQKLVNTLLEFSRIEAGRVEGRFAPLDVGHVTAELASTFRSAIEKVGMQLQILSYPVIGEVYVDIDMWEKIVLNLVSNAFKYSKEGVIRVEVRQAGLEIRLSVTDTGIGISEDQQEKIFDRFHRIGNNEGRSQEGTGIGLAMVRELVKLHHGSIHVQSRPGVGSTFTVSIPTGKEHLPADKIVVTLPEPRQSNSRSAFVEEANKWIAKPDEPAGGVQTGKRYKVLLADDNADMREYVQRLLSSEFNVLTAEDGEDALQKIREHKPDLLLSDIMMPKLDGFGLLKKLRGHPDTRNLPVIFLSARAGEEAKLEGLEAGANDYLVKPFSAKELMAVVHANIKIDEARRRAERDLYSFLMQAPFGIVVFSGPDYIVSLANDPYLPIIARNREDIIGRPVFEAVPEVAEQGFKQLLDGIRASGEPLFIKEYETVLFRNDRMETTYLNLAYQPLRTLKGEIDQIMIVVDEVTEQVIARRKRESDAREQAALLEEEVKKRTAELNRSNIALQQSNADLQQFAHVASHDLKEPLRKIRIFSGRLQDDPETRLSGNGRSYLEKIHGAIGRMMSMVEGVLDYSILNATQQSIEQVDLYEVLKNIEGDLELLIASKAADIRYERLPKLEGASVLIYQLFYNIIANSLKFSSPERRPEILIDHVMVSYGGREAIRIDVKDNGIGFPNDAVEKIFMTFGRLHSKDKYEGTGLGLSLCKRIVERHGGRISAKGEKGVGATFSIILPVYQEKTSI